MYNKYIQYCSTSNDILNSDFKHPAQLVLSYYEICQHRNSIINAITITSMTVARQPSKTKGFGKLRVESDLLEPLGFSN